MCQRKFSDVCDLGVRLEGFWNEAMTPFDNIETSGTKKFENWWQPENLLDQHVEVRKKLVLLKDLLKSS